MTLLRDILVEIDIEQHLKDRGVDMSRTNVIYDKDSGTAHFILYNLSGQLVGYQRYNPAEAKLRSNIGKYFTHITKESEKQKKIAVYGLETLKPNSKYLFVVEGIFDAIKIHNAGFPAVAVLQNNPKILKTWLPLLKQKIIVILDNDGSAGRKLAKFGDKAFTVPNPYKDLGEMPQQEATAFIKSVLK